MLEVPIDLIPVREAPIGQLRSTFTSRPQDWIDVEKVIIRQDAKLERELIKTELQPLLDLKEEPRRNGRSKQTIRQTRANIIL